MTTYLFYFLSFVALMCGMLMVASKNPVHSVLYLVMTFFAIAGHYVLLNAQFLAAVHVVVYAGAIMVLFLFVIMLLNLNKALDHRNPAIMRVIATVAGGSLLLVLVGSLKGSELIPASNAFNGQIGMIENLGQVLFKDFLLPFEIASILLLAAMVGAVMIGRKEVD